MPTSLLVLVVVLVMLSLRVVKEYDRGLHLRRHPREGAAHLNGPDDSARSPRYAPM
jgi:hypothetical protein